MATNDQVIAEVKSLRELFEERTGDRGIGGDIRQICIQMTTINGRLRATEIRVGQHDTWLQLLGGFELILLGAVALAKVAGLI